MESKELKEINIKNHTCYYFDDIIKVEDFNLDNILIDEKSYKNFFAYNMSYKTLIDAKPLHIRFDKTDRAYEGDRYLVLFKKENMTSFTKELHILLE